MFGVLVLVLRLANTGVYEILNSSESLLIKFRHFRHFVFGVLVLVLRHANAGVYEVNNSSESLLNKFRPFPYFCHLLHWKLLGPVQVLATYLCGVITQNLLCARSSSLSAKRPLSQF